MPVGFARSRLKRYLPHTYTRRTPGAGADEGSWGDAGQDYGPYVDAPCLYLDRETYAVGTQGLVAVRRVTLRVAHDDPVDVGDEISNVRDLTSGVVMMAGPITVRAESPTAPTGAVAYRTVRFDVPTQVD